MRTAYRVQSSATAPLRKITFRDDRHGGQYYTVAFYDAPQKTLNLCVSSQLGCQEKCGFCATAGHPFRGNLEVHQLSDQYVTGCSAMHDLLEASAAHLYIIMEGMGEPSYNIDNCLRAFSDSYQALDALFPAITYRVCSVGNIAMLPKYLDFVSASAGLLRTVAFKLQLSLHTPLEDERRWLIPVLSRRYDLSDIVEAFSQATARLGQKLRVNYLLLTYPNGECNYTPRHLDALRKLLSPGQTVLKLTRYSETGREFCSPPSPTYHAIADQLTEAGFEVRIREIYGADVDAACGMLHYATEEGPRS